jgi:6-phosphogluconate dehydrogenase|uniref:6-phosphogluconate dehydrogenase, decarboxylating n=1 Tax=Desulfobacca acetoxidans TaxID=60893 RepID=A0A7V6A3W5_9BACT
MKGSQDAAGPATCDLGLIGLGVMGRNLALNFADQGLKIAVYNRTTDKSRDFAAGEGGVPGIFPAMSLPELRDRLRQPRIILIMVLAGDPVDAVINALVPLLSPGDLIIDGGNSHFTDTDRRNASLAAAGLLFLGLGVSGGELGARYGPSFMPGGCRDGYERVEALLLAAAARVHGEPCVSYLGPGSAGHFVKMVHNGIEYALEQLIAEVYDLLRRGLGLNFDEMAEVFAGFNQGRVKSYLVEITSHILKRRDPESGQPLVDLIKDVAQQQGTGLWTVRTALDLGVPIPTIDVAVGLRRLSALKEEREAAAGVLPGPGPFFPGPGDRQGFIEKLGNALFASMVTTFAQGLTLLRRASEVYGYNLDLAEVVRLWRGGCIIRAALLEEVMAACRARPDLPNLLLDPVVGGKVTARQGDWREVAKAAAAWGLPAPALMASLAYLDAYRSRRLPASLIQAMRDCFGAHTYEREDSPGTFHTNWLAD